MIDAASAPHNAMPPMKTSSSANESSAPTASPSGCTIHPMIDPRAMAARNEPASAPTCAKADRYGGTPAGFV